MGYRRLYFSHFLSQFGDRLWKFATPILFVGVWPDTLLPAAVFLFLLYSIKLLFLPMVGRGIDETDRLKLVRASTIGQNSCICASVVLLSILGHRVHRTKAAFANSFFDLLLFVLLVLIGIVGDLCATAGTIGIEKDWVVVIAGNDDRMLTFLNSTLRRIDLFCKLVAPLSLGLILSTRESPYDQLMLGTGLVFVWSLLSVLPIYWAWRSVYFEYPALQSVKAAKKKMNPFRVLAECGATYCRHSVFGASFAYCCLYFTVLSDHHPLTTSFLEMSGVSPAALGGARAGGAFAGIVGTYVFPCLHERLGLAKAGVVSSWGFVAVILPVGLVYTHGDLESSNRAHFMLAAIVLSRVFLWCFDLANVQQMQEAVAESSRGEINAAQSALCNLMELFMATLSIFYATDFRVLVLGSVLGVTTAAVVLTCWSRRPIRPNVPDPTRDLRQTLSFAEMSTAHGSAPVA